MLRSEELVRSKGCRASPETEFSFMVKRKEVVVMDSDSMRDIQQDHLGQGSPPAVVVVAGGNVHLDRAVVKSSA